MKRTQPLQLQRNFEVSRRLRKHSVLSGVEYIRIRRLYNTEKWMHVYHDLEKLLARCSRSLQPDVVASHEVVQYGKACIHTCI